MSIPTLIKTLTADSDASLSFVDGAASVVLDGTYDEYMFVMTDVSPVTDWGDFQFTVSINGGTDYGVAITSTYFEPGSAESGSSSWISYGPSYDLANGTANQFLTYDTATSNDECYVGVMHLFSPANTTYVKHFYTYGQNYYGNNYSMGPRVAGYVNSTSAVDAIKFVMSTGNIQTGTIQLFGMS